MDTILKDFYFASSDPTLRARRRKLEGRGEIRKIGPKVYSSIMDDDDLKKCLTFQWPIIVKKLYPDTIVSFRTAFDYKPSPNGNIFLTAKLNKVVKMGPIQFIFIKGPEKLESDHSGLMGVTVSSRARAFLELLTPIRKGIVDGRSLPIEEIEKRLEAVLTNEGEEGLNDLRDQAKKINNQANFSKGFKELDKIIGALLGTKDKTLKGESAALRSKGLSYDHSRIHLFGELFSYLNSTSLVRLTDPLLGNLEHFNNKAFFESYFSNYIEGTKFLISEAEQIVFDKKEIEDRVYESHDISGTYQIVSDQNLMSKVMGNYEQFEKSLKYIHSIIMQERKDKIPGEFKVKENQAGNTIFVHPDLVRGTLVKGYDYYQALTHPLAKGIFLSFLISEVHPFSDGNGRVSRVVLNRELISAKMPSIIIPTVYRSDYIGALKSLTRRTTPSPLVKMFSRAQQFSSLDFSKYQEVKKLLIQRNWCEESDDAKILEQ